MRTQTESKSMDYTSNDTQLLLHYGYRTDKYLSRTMQGELYVAVDQNNNDEPVIIKKIALVNIDKFEFIKSKLLHSTKYNKSSTEIITLAKCIDIFQSGTYCYVVFEYDFTTSLQEFVTQSRQYIREGKLQLKQYKKTIKFLMWRLIKTIYTLHKYHKPCDLDLCTENIMLHSGDFIECSNGSVIINPEIDIRFLHFENFNEVSNLTNLLLGKRNRNHWCVFVSPNGQYSNMWAYGMILYFGLIGDFPHSDFGIISASNTRRITNYLGMFGLFKFVTANSISLLNGVLNFDEGNRLKINAILKHKWFREYS